MKVQMSRELLAIKETYEETRRSEPGLPAWADLNDEMALAFIDVYFRGRADAQNIRRGEVQL